MLSWVRRSSSTARISIDPKRLHPEIQGERRRELDGSVDRRRRIMDRMVQGYACPHPSWVQAIVTTETEDDEPLGTA
jgi:hypothetical protein